MSPDWAVFPTSSSQRTTLKPPIVSVLHIPIDHHIPQKTQSLSDISSNTRRASPTQPLSIDRSALLEAQERVFRIVEAPAMHVSAQNLRPEKTRIAGSMNDDLGVGLPGLVEVRNLRTVFQDRRKPSHQSFSSGDRIQTLGE
ncbi:hypothetical protein QJS10_CPA01g00683 [Acorus calamus]|uniref:PDZ domain-containing protein n=1 Tax=Acorus calamus TaxID=4465 RepID=A0AAV9FS73_ACOCL|nr:hypothetical protein QJS10_CPA01g00683 [Acorus calamus]